MTALFDIEFELPRAPRAVERDAQAGARAMRGTLREQIARLEAELPIGPGRASGGARLLDVDELERIRDDLVRRTQERRFTRGEEQEHNRILREKMLLDPAAHRGVSVTNADCGEPGCTRWTSWFRLTISGGCP